MALRWSYSAHSGQGTRCRSEYREHAAARVCRGRRHNRPTTRAPIGLADPLCQRPLAPSRREGFHSMRGEQPFRTEVGDVCQVDFEAPHVPWQTRLRRHAELRGVAVPLRPCSLVAIRQVERANDVATLPTTVGGFVSPKERIGSRPGYAPPGPGDVDDGRDGLDQEKESFSSSATRRDTSLYRPSLRASSGRSSSRASDGFWSHMAT